MNIKKMNKREIGKEAENISENFIINQGIKIIKRNYFTKFGEIDLIGFENKTIIFIEVKFRKNKNFGEPFESVNFRKKQKIQMTTDQFLIEKKLLDCECRFDVIGIAFCNGNYKIEWLKNQYFDFEDIIYMVKKARPRNLKRIRDLKIKINTEEYLHLAISRIAGLLSQEILGL